jgi:hypothetical protein
MGLGVFERIGFPVIVLAAVSCTNGASVSDGFGLDSVNPSDDGGGGSGDGASTNRPSNATASAQGGQDAAPSQTGPSQTGSNDGGASQSSNRDSSAGRADSGGGQSDATVATVDASTVDASSPDVSATTYDAAVCTTQNLGCMLAPPPSTGDARQDCVNRINQFRTQCACLPPLQRWTAGEQCADLEATYDSQNNTAHGGFIQTETACSQGSSMWAPCCGMSTFGGAGPLANAQDECPGYPDTQTVISTCLQQMWDEGPPPNGVQACMQDQACFQMHGHFINMTSTTSTKVACGFSSMTGMLWAAQNFAP